ncbi:POM121-like protein 2 [Tenrec ecaudatus]|uniref:POM121-like protein 2 n=1 Tax=Tenrec ecaudatus TaxID=94439 RepID=UPI003F5AC03E
MRSVGTPSASRWPEAQPSREGPRSTEGARSLPGGRQLPAAQARAHLPEGAGAPLHRAQPATGPPPAGSRPTWGLIRPGARTANEAWRRFPMKRSQNSIMGPLPSDWWESYSKRTIWSLRHPGATRSSVTVKIAPPERRTLPAQCPAPPRVACAEPQPCEERPDPCAKETVLRALRGCKKARLRSPERACPESAGRPELRPSAFRPLMKNGVFPSFVPTPGPLRRSPHSCGCTDTNGPLSFQRNAIASSYSSSRRLSEPPKRLSSSALIQTPEWPIKKVDKINQSHSPVPLVSALETPGAACSSRQPSLQLLSSPEDLPVTPAPQYDYSVLTEKTGLQGSNKGRENKTQITADSAPETWPGSQPFAPVTLSSGVIAPTQGTNPPSTESSEKMQTSSLIFPLSTRHGASLAHLPGKTLRLLTPIGSALPESFPGTSKPTVTATILSLAPPQSPFTGHTGSPVISQSGGSTVPPDPSAIIPATPATQSVSFEIMSSPAARLPMCAPAAGTSAGPTVKLISQSPPNGKMGGSTEFGIISFTTAASACWLFPTTPGILTYTVKPKVGSLGSTLSVKAPFDSKPISPSDTDASTSLCPGPGKATAVVIPTTPPSTSKDSASKLPWKLGGSNALGFSTPGSNAYSVPSTCHASLCACGPGSSFPSATGSSLPLHQHATILPAHTASVFTWAPPGMNDPLPTSTLANQPALAFSSATSPPTLAPTILAESSSTPPFSTSPRATSQTARGAEDGQKQDVSQPALTPSFNRSFFYGNCAVASSPPTSTLVQPILGNTAHSPFEGLPTSASTSSPPVIILPASASTPKGFPLDQAATPALGVATQTYPSGVSGPVFGSTAPRPFAFGGLVTPMDYGESGTSTAGSISRDFSTGSVPSGTTSSTMLFGEDWNQNSQGLPSRSVTVSLGMASTSSPKTLVQVPALPHFAQSFLVPGSDKAGSFGTPPPSFQGSSGRGLLTPSDPAFSIGTKAKTPKNLEQGDAQRHHCHQK